MLDNQYRQATKAAIRAGYSAKTAEQQGFQLLQKTSVAEAIAQVQEARSIRTEITQDMVLEELAKIAAIDTDALVEKSAQQIKDSIEQASDVAGTQMSRDSQYVLA